MNGYCVFMHIITILFGRSILKAFQLPDILIDLMDYYSKIDPNFPVNYHYRALCGKLPPKSILIFGKSARKPLGHLLLAEMYTKKMEVLPPDRESDITLSRGINSEL